MDSRSVSAAAVSNAIRSESYRIVLTLLPTVRREGMSHYAAVLHCFGVRKEIAHLWRHYIPQLALRHSFLMHGLLAFSALHLAYVKPENNSKYLQLSDKHQSVALQEFRSILASNIDPEHADTSFALAATLSISFMARSCALSESATMDLNAITELFVLTKGVATVLRSSARERIVQGPLGEMLHGSAYPQGIEVQLPLDVASRFSALRLMLVTYGLHQPALEYCRSALAELEMTYKTIAYFAPNTDIEIGMVSRWQVAVSMEYVRLIQARNPPALIILAHYAAAVASIRTAWYTQNWAEYALCGISEMLDDDMQHWIQWPVQQAQDKMCILGVSSPSYEE